MRDFFKSYLIDCFLLLATVADSAKTSGILFHDWAPACAAGSRTNITTNDSGTINGSNTIPGFAGQRGSYGLPLGLTTQSPGRYTQPVLNQIFCLRILSRGRNHFEL